MDNKKLYFWMQFPVLIIACLLVYMTVLSPVIVEGIVEHKAVTGVEGGVTYTILVNRPVENGSWILIKDKDYGMFFSKEEKNAFIDKNMEDEMKNEYSDIKYIVSIRLNSSDPVNNLEKGDTLAYFVSRDEFNRMKIGDRVKYEVSRFSKSTINRLVEIEKVYPHEVGYTYFNNYKLINNTDSFLIETYEPLTEEQIKILRNSGVRELSSSEVKTVYHSLIEESKVNEIRNLSFVKRVYHYKLK